MNKLLVVVGGAALFGAVVFLIRPRTEEVADAQADPGWGRHRGLPYISRPGAGIGAPIRMASAQEPKVTDAKGYPYDKTTPSAMAQGYWKGPAMTPIGYSPIDYGHAPVRIPRQWRDSIRYWDGVAQRGFTQQNYRVFLFHLRPSMPTRGYRSISGVLYSGGPTASRRRIPAVFVPTSVA